MQEIKEEIFYPKNKTEWRTWLEENHISKQSIWIMYYKKKSSHPTISWSEAVDEALCFGWIDSTAKSFDNESYIQFFTKRKPNSVWSKINKEKTYQLIEKGLMMQAGYKSIEIAQQNGSWNILDDVEELKIPHDLADALKKEKEAEAYFLGLSKSVKKSILQWLVLAKTKETRTKRIQEISELAAQKMKPKQFR